MIDRHNVGADRNNSAAARRNFKPVVAASFPGALTRGLTVRHSGQAVLTFATEGAYLTSSVVISESVVVASESADVASESEVVVSKSAVAASAAEAVVFSWRSSFLHPRS